MAAFTGGGAYYSPVVAGPRVLSVGKTLLRAATAVPVLGRGQMVSRAGAARFSPLSVPVVVRQASARLAGTSIPVAVRRDATRSVIARARISMDAPENPLSNPTHEIRGTVLTPGGLPYRSEAVVSLYRARDGAFIASTPSAPDGSYVFPRMRSDTDTYFVVVWAPGYQAVSPRTLVPRPAA